MKKKETVATATTASVAPVYEQSLHKEKRGDVNGQQPKVQPMRFTQVRQTAGEASPSSMMSTEQEEQSTAHSEHRSSIHFQKFQAGTKGQRK